MQHLVQSPKGRTGSRNPFAVKNQQHWETKYEGERKTKMKPTGLEQNENWQQVKLQTGKERGELQNKTGNAEQERRRADEV